MPSKNGKVPMPGDGVWHPEYKNGVVLLVLWEDKTAIVEWYNSKQQQEIDFDNFYDTFHERLNQWILE
jgi:heme-degrading monooxygenase HmoA